MGCCRRPLGRQTPLRLFVDEALEIALDLAEELLLLDVAVLDLGLGGFEASLLGVELGLLGLEIGAVLGEGVAGGAVAVDQVGVAIADRPPHSAGPASGAGSVLTGWLRRIAS